MLHLLCMCFICLLQFWILFSPDNTTWYTSAKKMSPSTLSVQQVLPSALPLAKSMNNFLGAFCTEQNVEQSLSYLNRVNQLIDQNVLLEIKESLQGNSPLLSGRDCSGTFNKSCWSSWKERDWVLHLYI